MPLEAAAVDHIGVASRLSSNMRTLHWVTKIGSLKNSLRFYELVFGFRVLRHEEFESGCEATCNGPYGGAWSKTMVGLGKGSQALSLLRRLLEYDPAKRISAQQALEHEYFRTQPFPGSSFSL